jgi:hypothetical protein
MAPSREAVQVIAAPEQSRRAAGEVRQADPRDARIGPEQVQVPQRPETERPGVSPAQPGSNRTAHEATHVLGRLRGRGYGIVQYDVEGPARVAHRVYSRVSRHT